MLCTLSILGPEPAALEAYLKTIFIFACNSNNINNNVLILLDTDECASPEANNCDVNALCTNTDGSYICRCIRGYEGDGRNCTGIYQVYFPQRFIVDNCKGQSENATIVIVLSL